MLGVVIGVFALVLCCAGPALIAGGALSAMGTALRSPIVIAIGVAFGVTAVSITLGCRAHGAGGKAQR